jgi:hypothetical protein
MRGFSQKWRDVPDFILGITKKIWEDRQFSSLEHRYAPGLILRSPASVLVDNSVVIAATMATLAEFPDWELLGEDVIWCEDSDNADEESDAFLSLHRLIWLMPLRAAVRWPLHGKHVGWGSFGAPTGASVYIMGITHAEFGPRGLRREFTLIDETAIWKQILLAKG